MCVLSVLMAPSMVIRYNMGWYEMLLIDIPLFFAATASVANFYMVCQRELYPLTWTERLRYLPFLMSIGIGLAVNNTKAVFEALFHKPSEFARTPKYHIEGRSDEWIGKKYRQSVALQPMIEVALGLYFTATLFYALANGIYATVPFLMLFQVGFLYTGLLSIFQQYADDTVVEVVQSEAKRDVRRREVQGRPRRRRCDDVGDLLSRRRSRCARVSRVRRSRSRAVRHLRGSLLPALARAVCRPKRRARAICSRSWPRRARCRKPIIRLMKMLPASDGMDALRTLTSALGHYDPDASDNSPAGVLSQVGSAHRADRQPGRHLGPHAAGRRRHRSRIRRWDTRPAFSTC